MYNNLLGGADVITLTAGVGENSKTMRKSIIEKIASLGVKIDDEKMISVENSVLFQQMTQKFQYMLFQQMKN